MTRRTFHSLTAGTVLGSAWAHGAALPAADSRQITPFPYGTHVYREPSLPLEQLRADFPLLKLLGFTMIKIQESWNYDEAKEGEINLSRVAQVVADAKQNNLLVYFGITMEQAPAWLWRKYPDAAMRYENNQPVIDPTQYLLPNDGKPGPCWHHPGAREAAIRFIEAVGREIGQYDNILVWNVWQEIGFGFDANVSRVCFCPHTLAAFRVWLRSKYGDLSHLNRIWRTPYAEWDEVDPPRVFLKVPSFLDWRYFMDNVYLTDVLRWKAEAFRRSDRGQRKILAHTPTPHYGSSADWRWARAGLDIYGSSAYPAWGEYQDPAGAGENRLQTSPAPYQQVLDNALKWDYVRSASVHGEFWTAELQGGRAGGGVMPGRVPDAGDIRRWVLGALAGGARGICFWNHRSEIFWDEAYGFGLLELEGDRTERAEEAGRIARSIDAQAADLLGHGSCPLAKTGILLDEETWNFIVASGDTLRSHFITHLRGIHRGLWQEAIPVDFLDSTELATRGGQYKALILPLPMYMSDELMRGVSGYVQNGGALISGPFPGRFSHYAFASPGELPRASCRLFGVEHKGIITLSDRSTHPSQNSLKPKEAQPLKLIGVDELSRMDVEPSLYLHYLTLTTAKAVLQQGGEIVGTRNGFGKGRAWLIGTLWGSPIGDGGKTNQKLMVTMLKEAGIEPERAGHLIKRRRELHNRAAWFLFNPMREVVEETVALENFKSAGDLLGSTLTVANGSVRVRVEPLDFCCLLLS